MLRWLEIELWIWLVELWRGWPWRRDAGARRRRRREARRWWLERRKMMRRAETKSVQEILERKGKSK